MSGFATATQLMSVGTADLYLSGGLPGYYPDNTVAPGHATDSDVQCWNKKKVRMGLASALPQTPAMAGVHSRQPGACLSFVPQRDTQRLHPFAYSLDEQYNVCEKHACQYGS